MPVCERCRGKGTVTYTTSDITRHCPVCLGLGNLAPRRQRPLREHHLIAIHDTTMDWDEVVAMLPLREPKENWDE